MDDAPKVLAQMDDCNTCFAGWAPLREPGVFNASGVASAERGAKAYRCMGYGELEGESSMLFAVIVAVRELLQNGFDAGGTMLSVGVVCYPDGTVLLFVRDNAPNANRLTLKLFNEVFMCMDVSSKPGVSAGGKGQAKVALSTMDGLTMYGGNGFAASVGVKYSAALDSDTPLVTYKAATEEQRDTMSRCLSAARPLAEGSLVVVRVKNVKNMSNCERALQHYLSMCELPVVCSWRNAPTAPTIVVPRLCLPEPLADCVTIRRTTSKGVAVLTLTVTGKDKHYPYGSWGGAGSILMHVRCRKVLMFTRLTSVHNICNSDNVQVIVDIEGAADDAGGVLTNAELFTVQRGDLRPDRLGFSLKDVAQIAAKEFQGHLHKPCNFIRTATTAGKPILENVMPHILRQLGIVPTGDGDDDGGDGGDGEGDGEGDGGGDGASNGLVGGGRTKKPDLQLLEYGVDCPDPATRHDRVEGELEGCEAKMPVMYINENGEVFEQSKDKLEVPDADEVALVRYSTLLSTVCVVAFNMMEGDDRVPPPVGALFDESESFLGMAKANTVYINVRRYVTQMRDEGSIGGQRLPHHLNEMVKTVVHETAHILGDPEENHDVNFWNLMVDLLVDKTVTGCIALLLNMAKVPKNSTMNASAALRRMTAKLCGGRVAASARPVRKAAVVAAAAAAAAAEMEAEEAAEEKDDAGEADDDDDVIVLDGPPSAVKRGRRSAQSLGSAASEDAEEAEELEAGQRTGSCGNKRARVPSTSMDGAADEDKEEAEACDV